MLHSHCFYQPRSDIRTSTFGAEAVRCYIFLRSEAENVHNMFLISYMIYFVSPDDFDDEEVILEQI